MTPKRRYSLLLLFALVPVLTNRDYSTPAYARQTAARAECKACEPLADRLRQVTEAENRFRAQQEETAAQYRAMLRAQESDEVMLDHFHEMMHEYNMSDPLSEDRGINAQRKYARTRIAMLEAQIAARDGAIQAIRATLDALISQETSLILEKVAAGKELTECNQRCAAGAETRQSSWLERTWYVPVTGGAVLGGIVLSGGNDSTAPSATPPATTTPPTTTASPAPSPTQPSCGSIAGAYSFTGTLQTPRRCFFAGTVPIFSSPVSGDLTLQVEDACAGTLIMRYPNTWTFVHRVTTAPAGSNWQVRSSVPFMSTQPFGLPFSSTIDLTVSGNSFAGLETHASSGCTDIYVLQGSR